MVVRERGKGSKGQFLFCESFMSFLKEEGFVNWDTIRIWVAIILLLDASFGLWNHARFEKLVPKINIAKTALIEGGVALLLIGFNFWLN